MKPTTGSNVPLGGTDETLSGVKRAETGTEAGRELLERIRKAIINDVKESDGEHWEYPESELEALMTAITPVVLAAAPHAPAESTGPRQYITGEGLKALAIKKDNFKLVGGFQFAEQFDWERIAVDVNIVVHGTASAESALPPQGGQPSSAETEKLREALVAIRDGDDACGCDCGNDPDCCVTVGEYCPHCIATHALAAQRESEER